MLLRWGGVLTDLESRLKGVESKASSLESKTSNLENKTSNLESKTSSLESQTTNIQNNITAITNQGVFFPDFSKLIGTDYRGGYYSDAPIIPNWHPLNNPASPAVTITQDCFLVVTMTAFNGYQGENIASWFDFYIDYRPVARASAEIYDELAKYNSSTTSASFFVQKGSKYYYRCGPDDRWDAEGKYLRDPNIVNWANIRMYALKRP